MQEKEIRGLIDQVKEGAVSRRAFVQRMLAVGVAAPMAGMMLSYNGVSIAQDRFDYKPTKAGGGGRFCRKLVFATDESHAWQPHGARISNCSASDGAGLQA